MTNVEEITINEAISGRKHPANPKFSPPTFYPARLNTVLFKL